MKKSLLPSLFDRRKSPRNYGKRLGTLLQIRNQRSRIIGMSLFDWRAGYGFVRALASLESSCGLRSAELRQREPEIDAIPRKRRKEAESSPVMISYRQSPKHPINIEVLDFKTHSKAELQQGYTKSRELSRPIEQLNRCKRSQNARGYHATTHAWHLSKKQHQIPQPENNLFCLLSSEIPTRDRQADFCK